MLNLNVIHLLMLCVFIVMVIIGFVIYISVKDSIDDSFQPIRPSFREIVEEICKPTHLMLSIIKDEILFLCNLNIYKVNNTSNIEYTIKYKKIAVNMIQKIDNPYIISNLAIKDFIFISEPTNYITNTQDTLLFLKIILSDTQQLELEKHIFSII